MNIELIPNEQLFEAIGEIRWYDISRDEYIYQVGVAFIDIKNNGKEQLLRFLKTLPENFIAASFIIFFKPDIPTDAVATT